jgi:hypothetical protein
MKKTIKKSSIKKAQDGATKKKASSVPKYISPYKSERTADSTQYFDEKLNDIAEANRNIGTRSMSSNASSVQKDNSKELKKTMVDLSRQGLKGKKGFDKNGFPITYKQAQVSASKKKMGGKVTKSKMVAKVVKKSAKKK